MVNSATALALRPGRVDDPDAALARRGHVDIDGAAARDGDQLQPGRRSIMPAEKRRELGHDDRRVADEARRSRPARP